MILKPFSRYDPIRKIENIWGFDSEDDSKGTCLQAGFYNGARFIFYDLFEIPQVISFFDLLVLTKEKHYFFSNNILYDLINVFGQNQIIENLNNGNFKFLMTKYGFISAVYKNRIIFIDLQNYYRNMSLKKIGEIFGVKKLDFNPESREYMKQDILIGYLAGFHLVEFLEKHLDILRRGYKGGRCEMYYKGTRSPVHIYDVNSLYPYIMSTVNFLNPDTIKPSFEIVKNGIYAVKLKAKETWLPLLPEETSSIYPIGNFSSVVLGSDLLEDFKNYEVIEIEWGFQFDYSGKIFKSFALDLYKKRLQSVNKFENLFFKLMMNNLYGKFGISKNKIIWDKTKSKFDEIESNYEYYAYVIWAIQVTSNARKTMYDHMVKELDRSNDIYYTDTDSLHVRKPIKKALINSSILGCFKDEGVFDQMTYEREKEYYSNDFLKIACKGVHGNLDQIKNYFKTGTSIINRPIKLKEAINRKLMANIWITQEKKGRTVNPKRQIFENGETFPLILNK